jgi:hypothetical protein
MQFWFPATAEKRVICGRLLKSFKSVPVNWDFAEKAGSQPPFTMAF